MFAPKHHTSKGVASHSEHVRVHCTHLSYVTNRTHQVLSAWAVSAKWRRLTHLPSEKRRLLLVVIANARE